MENQNFQNQNCCYHIWWHINLFIESLICVFMILAVLALHKSNVETMTGQYLMVGKMFKSASKRKHPINNKKYILSNAWLHLYILDILSQLPVRNAQPLHTSVDGQSIGHMTVVEPESGCTHLCIKHRTRKWGKKMNNERFLASCRVVASMNTHQNSPVVGVATAEELSCIILRSEWSKIQMF